jgi:hypothetical protein
MNDKELLELAAKAAGYSTSKYWHNDGVQAGAEYAYTDGPHSWNPLTDDGDALRLAVKLGIDVLQLEKSKSAYANNSQVVYSDAADPYAATRRAIVRAAAEIGRDTQ